MVKFFKSYDIVDSIIKAVNDLGEIVTVNIYCKNKLKAHFYTVKEIKVSTLWDDTKALVFYFQDTTYSTHCVWVPDFLQKNDYTGLTYYLDRDNKILTINTVNE